MLTEHTVSILIPTYNHEQYISKALASILTQQCSARLEVHVFDDCSTDKTAEIVAQYAKEHPEVVKLYQNPENLGSGLASFSYHQVPVRSEFWCILEGDDYWISETCLQDKLDVLSRDLNLVGCAGNTQVLKEGQESNLITTYFQTFNLADSAYYQKMHSFYIHTSSLLWRNIFPDNIPPFPDGFYDIKGDPALMNMMMGAKRSIHRLDKVVSAYRITGQGRWTRLSEDEQLKRNKEYAKKVLSCWPLRHRLLQRMVSSNIFRFLTMRLADQLIKFRLLPKPLNIERKL